MPSRKVRRYFTGVRSDFDGISLLQGNEREYCRIRPQVVFCASSERYRSGHNGPDSKSGWGLHSHVGSNPTLSAKPQVSGFPVGTLRLTWPAFLTTHLLRRAICPLLLRCTRATCST